MTIPIMIINNMIIVSHHGVSVGPFGFDVDLPVISHVSVTSYFPSDSPVTISDIVSAMPDAVSVNPFHKSPAVSNAPSIIPFSLAESPRYSYASSSSKDIVVTVWLPPPPPRSLRLQTVSRPRRRKRRHRSRTRRTFRSLGRFS